MKEIRMPSGYYLRTKQIKNGKAIRIEVESETLELDTYYDQPLTETLLQTEFKNQLKNICRP